MVMLLRILSLKQNLISFASCSNKIARHLSMGFLSFQRGIWKWKIKEKHSLKKDAPESSLANWLASSIHIQSKQAFFPTPIGRLWQPKQILNSKLTSKFVIIQKFDLGAEQSWSNCNSIQHFQSNDNWQYPDRSWDDGYNIGSFWKKSL